MMIVLVQWSKSYARSSWFHLNTISDRLERTSTMPALAYAFRPDSIFESAPVVTDDQWLTTNSQLSLYLSPNSRASRDRVYAKMRYHGSATDTWIGISGFSAVVCLLTFIFLSVLNISVRNSVIFGGNVRLSDSATN